MSLARVDGERAIAGLRATMRSVVLGAEEVLDASMKVARDAAISTDKFQNRTGATRAMPEPKRAGMRGFVEARGAAKFLEEGTRPHLIVAHGKALRFVSGGQVIFRKWVNHPGTKATRYMSEARNKAEAFVDVYAGVIVGAAISRARA
jgi:hypothetical protein